jgi:hypothetical protein
MICPETLELYLTDEHFASGTLPPVYPYPAILFVYFFIFHYHLASRLNLIQSSRDAWYLAPAARAGLR